MTSGTLALTIRALREDSRLIRAHMLRFLLVGVVLFFLLMTHIGSFRFGAPGLEFFGEMTHVSFWFITLAAIGYFSNAITEEKEELTLGLMKMAGLNPVAILLGKSVPRLIGAILILSAQLPFTLLAITLGGVTTHQVLAAYVALLAYLLLAGNLGLLCSVWCQRSNSSSSLTGFSLALFFIGPFFIQLMGMIRTSRGAIGDWLLFGPLIRGIADWVSGASVFNRISSIMTTGFSDPVVGYQVISNVVAAGVCFGLAWLSFEPMTRNEVRLAPSRGLFRKRRGRQGRFASGRAWSNAVVWKDFSFIVGGRMALLLKLLFYGSVVPALGFSLASIGQSRFQLSDLGAAYMWTMLAAMMIELAAFVSRVFHEEIKWQTLSTLTLLPLSTPELAYRKIAGGLLGLLPALTIFVVGVVLDPQDFEKVLNDLVPEPGAWLLVVQYLLFLHLTAYLSLVVKWGALPLAFGVVYIFGYLFLATIASVLRFGGQIEGIFGFLSLTGLAIIVGLHFAIGHQLRAAAAK